jgi:hypothetical protein
VDLAGGAAEVKARTSNLASFANALEWENCEPLDKNMKPDRDHGVFDLDRYMQYRVALLNNTGKSPEFEEIEFKLEAGDETGPETSGVSLWPDPVGAALEVLVQAQVSDVNVGGSIVTAAEYFVDEEPGAGGSGTALDPTDGQWDSALEAVRAEVSPVGWGEADSHTLYIRGADGRGNWGPPQAYTFQMGDVSFFPEAECFPYPNPATGDELRVRYFVTKQAEVKLEVFDLRGRLVTETSGEADGYTHAYLALDISGLAPDVYLYRATATAAATGESEVVSKKFAVVR